jgi:tetratricopeptide (TPR) repeat protein
LRARVGFIGAAVLFGLTHARRGRADPTVATSVAPTDDSADGADDPDAARLLVDKEAIAERLARIDALIAAADPEAAAVEADGLPALDPADPELAARRLQVLGLAPSRRSEAIVGLQAQLVVEPGDLRARKQLATYLSWTPGGLPEALVEWQELVRRSPRDREAQLGLARALAWSGRSNEAIAVLDPVIASNPKFGEALLLRSQLARWAGDRRQARALLERAALAMPRDVRVQAERARLLDDGGQRTEALREARAAQKRSPGLYEADEAIVAVEAATRGTASLRVTQSQESSGFERVGGTMPIVLFPLPDSEVRVEPTWARFAEPDDSVDRFSLGIDLRQGGFPQGVYLRPSWRLQAPLADGPGPFHEWAFEVGALRPFDRRVDLRVGARRRGLGDLPAPEYETVAPLAGIGAGGGTVATVADGLSTRELWGAAAVNPLPGGYVYAEYTGGFVEDGNRAQSLATGLGQDVLALGDQPRRQALTAKLDLYRLHVAIPVDRYFSPDSLLVLTPGAEWRLRPSDGNVVGVEAGVPLRAGASPGYLVGAFGGVALGDRWSFEGRVRAFDDTTWRIVAGTLGVGAKL